MIGEWNVLGNLNNGLEIIESQYVDRDAYYIDKNNRKLYIHPSYLNTVPTEKMRYETLVIKILAGEVRWI